MPHIAIRRRDDAHAVMNVVVVLHLQINNQAGSDKSRSLCIPVGMGADVDVHTAKSMLTQKVCF